MAEGDDVAWRSYQPLLALWNALITTHSFVQIASLEEIEQSPHDEQTILWTLVDRYFPHRRS